MTEQEYKALKEEHESAASAASEARGALKNLMARLKGEFKLNSVEEAKARLKKLSAEKARLEKELDAAVSQYQEEFPG